MTPVIINIDDVQMTLHDIVPNKRYECACTSDQESCHLKQKLSLCPSPEHLVATELSLNIRNVSDEVFPIDTPCWELVDSDGYAYRAQIICDALRKPRTIDLNLHHGVSPGTQVDVTLLFPEMKADARIACLYYLRHRDFYL